MALKRPMRGSPRLSAMDPNDKLEHCVEVQLTGDSTDNSTLHLPLASSRRRGAPNVDNNASEKQTQQKQKGTVAQWMTRVRRVALSRQLLTLRGTHSVRKCLLLVGVVVVVLSSTSALLALEVMGRMRFQGYFMPKRSHNGLLGFYHEMDVDMQSVKDATGRPNGKLFPSSEVNARELKAWVAERRKRTNGRKFLVGCSAHWKGYVLRSFLALFETLKAEHGWKDLDTTKNPMNVLYDMDRKRAPSVMFFCLNSFYYPMALLQEHSAYFHELRALGTIIAVWNDDLHYYDQFNPIVLRDQIFTKVDVVVSTYAYFMDDYFASVTDSVNGRDLPLTVWLPHSSSPDFVNASFNEHPINKILLSGKLGSNWYPLRHWLGMYQQGHQDVMDVYPHSGYNVADNQSAIYASYLRSYRTGITTTLIFQYVIAKIFEIPSTGALLAVNRDVGPLLTALGMNEGEHYVGFDRRDPEAAMLWVNDPTNWLEIDRIRRAGMDLVREKHLVANRVKALDLFMMEGEAVYKSPPKLHLTSPCPSKALPNEYECQTRFDRESYYKCDRWFCGAHSIVKL